MKKVLAFVLSVAMVICLMPAMAFAADTTDTTTETTGLSQFTDADSITNKEAVSVLVGLGVINGMGDGTFAPQGDVTRAQVATLISILVRSGDSSSLSAPSSDPFTDVAKDNWAAPYVAYGVSQGYINGRGDGTFDPDGNVTTAELATILEQILGYSTSDVAYEWPENAMAFATEAGLLEDISKSANENLDREEAAQMIFNALKATDVVKATVTGDNGDTSYYPVTNSSSLSYTGDDTDITEQLVEKLFPKVTYKADSTDAFGRESVAWKNGRTQISDEVIEEPDYTYTSKQTTKALNSDLDGYTVDAEVLVNGSTSTAADSISDIAALTGNGVLVELYTNEKDTEINKVIVAEYLPFEVTAVKSSQISLTYTSADGTTTQNLTVTSDDDIYDTIKAAAKGDVVLVAVSPEDDTDVLDAYFATSVSGVVSKSTSTAVTVDGTDYSKAAILTAAASNLSAGTDEKVIYLDKYGYVVDAQGVEADVANYVLVTGIRTAKSTTSGDPYISGSDTTSTDYYMMAVTEDGTVLDDVKLADYSSLSSTIQAIAYNPALDDDGDEVTTNDTDDDAVYPGSVTSTDTSYAFVAAYTETADGYVLLNTDASGKSSIGTYTGVVPSTNNKINGVYISADAQTITVDANGSTVTATAEDGVPALTADTYKYIIKNGYVDTVFVVETAETSADTIYVSGATGSTANFTDKNGTVRTGIEVTYYTASSADPQTMIVDSDVTSAGFYTAAANGEGYTLTAASSVGTDATVSSVYNGVVTFSNGNQDGYTIGDVAIRDTRSSSAVTSSGVDLITTADELAAALTDNTVSVTYVVSGTTATQIYITSVVANS
ncbi:MAG: S-layer homology domain-containing protein [Anaerovoracaceae bacterium]